MKKNLVLLLFAVILLNSCGVTYKKENLTQDLEKLVKKEAEQDAKAYIVGRTLYLDMQVKGLNPLVAERGEFDKAFSKLKIVGVDITRVVLSSDSDIKFMVVNACDPAYTILIRLVQNIDDTKDHFYMRISKSDYESRSLLEIFEYSIADIIRDKHDISQDEFVGRLIASKLNALQIVGNAQYVAVRNKILFLVLLGNLNVKNISLIEDFLKGQLKDYSKKYNNPFNVIEVLNLNGTRVMSVFLDAK
ncbi:MAG: hypothetical protein LBH33_02070 [Endomicrobium sp.]|nr:hypothetical protein [Endomicrobium sp.]